MAIVSRASQNWCRPTRRYPPSHCTCLKPDEPPKRPDPAIYSQAEQLSLGLAPTWNRTTSPRTSSSLGRCCRKAYGDRAQPVDGSERGQHARPLLLRRLSGSERAHPALARNRSASRRAPRPPRLPNERRPCSPAIRASAHTPSSNIRTIPRRSTTAARRRSSACSPPMWVATSSSTSRS